MHFCTFLVLFGYVCTCMDVVFPKNHYMFFRHGTRRELCGACIASPDLRSKQKAGGIHFVAQPCTSFLPPFLSYTASMLEASGDSGRLLNYRKLSTCTPYCARKKLIPRDGVGIPKNMRWDPEKALNQEAIPRSTFLHLIWA